MEGFIISIQKNDIKEFKRLLENFLIAPLNKDLSDDVLSLLINTCVEFNNDVFLKILLNIWKDNNINEEKIPTISYIFSLNRINNSSLVKISNLYTEYSVLEHYSNYLEFGDKKETLISFDNLNNTYGTLSHSEYKILYEFSLYTNNKTGEIFLIDKLKETSDYKEIPVWIIPKQNVNLNFLKDIHDKKYILPGVDEFVNVMSEGILINKKTIQERIRTFYHESKNEIKYHLYADVMRKKDLKKLEDNMDIFRFFGPTNLEVDYNYDDECYYYGGCRMLKCDCQDEWFTGNCDVCFKKILKKQYCVRFPNINGGWSGQYCSWECIKNSKTLYDEEKKLLEYYENKVLKEKIYDI